MAPAGRSCPRSAYIAASRRPAGARGCHKGAHREAQLEFSQHAAEIIYVGMEELETEAAVPFCAKTGAQMDRKRGLIRQSDPQLVAPAAANSLD